MPRNKGKRYCFTLNNYGEEDYDRLRSVIEADASYGILGKEVGESGTPHIQGYVIFRDWCDCKSAKDRLNARLHVEIARGTPRQNRTYCSKGGDYWEHGVCPASGSSSGKSESRDELARRFASSMESGYDGMVRFADEQPGTWYFSGSSMLRNYHALRRPCHRPDITVSWYYGPPGTGKSRKAHEELPEAYIKEPRTKWWNGYLGEAQVIIDDFGPGGIDINHLLRWFDRYKCLVESKGGMLPLAATCFIVTSNFHPSQLFTESVMRFEGNTSTSHSSSHPQLPALMRRIKLIEFPYDPNT